jgi:uncharacterized protein YecE (DUF72 family)
MEIYKGLILVYPHGDYIVNNKKTMIVKSLNLTQIINKPLLLVQRKQALGIIYLGDIITINKKEFMDYYKYHLVNPKEKKEWWKTKTKFYLYPIIKKKIFKVPIPIEYPQGPQVLINPQNIKLVQQLYIGTSGYSYPFWNRIYYPKSVNKFQYYSNDFKSVEINNSFYRIVDKFVWKKWNEESNKNFVFSAKVYMGFTRYHKLESLHKFWNNAKYLLPKLKCLLFQFPKTFKYNDKNVSLLKKINLPILCAFEFRDSSWFNDDVYKLFKKRKWTIVISYTHDNKFTPKDYVQTSNFVYFRLHGTTNQYQGSHSKLLLNLAKFIRSLDITKAFVYFNNTDSNDKKIPDAIYDAKKFNSLMLI